MVTVRYLKLLIQVGNDTDRAYNLHCNLDMKKSFRNHQSDITIDVSNSFDAGQTLVTNTTGIYELSICQFKNIQVIIQILDINRIIF